MEPLDLSSLLGSPTPALGRQMSLSGLGSPLAARHLGLLMADYDSPSSTNDGFDIRELPLLGGLSELRDLPPLPVICQSPVPAARSSAVCSPPAAPAGASQLPRLSLREAEAMTSVSSSGSDQDNWANAQAPTPTTAPAPAPKRRAFKRDPDPDTEPESEEEEDEDEWEGGRRRRPAKGVRPRQVTVTRARKTRAASPEPPSAPPPSKRPRNGGGRRQRAAQPLTSQGAPGAATAHSDQPAKHFRKKMQQGSLGVVQLFGVVKTGFDGRMTLQQLNERIMAQAHEAGQA